MIKCKYKHTNLIANNWKTLARFYELVFGCKPVPPERNLKGIWLEKGTGVKGAGFSGIHLLLPGHDDLGPTLEIYQYTSNIKKSPTCANREGFGHIAFEVNNVAEATSTVLKYGGTKIGDITSSGIIRSWHSLFVYWQIQRVI